MDESYFTDDKGQQFAGYGSFITADDLATPFLDEAFSILDTLELTRSKDIKSRNERFFHASDNSRAVQEIFKDAIKDKLSGEFNSMFFNLETSPLKGTDTCFLYAMQLTIGSVFKYKLPFHIIIERREGLSVEMIKDGVNSIFTNAVNSSLTEVNEHDRIPFSISIREKQVPGLQVIDFLTWAVQRKFSRDDEYTFKELSMDRNCSSATDSINSSINHSSFIGSPHFYSEFIKESHS